jgi:hypothetical protein
MFKIILNIYSSILFFKKLDVINDYGYVPFVVRKAKLRELIKFKIQIYNIYCTDCMVEIPLALQSSFDTNTHCLGLLFLAEKLYNTRCNGEGYTSRNKSQ